MLKELRIPRMGSVENAKLVEWRIAEGEAFAEGDLLYEVETDKTTTEVEATEGGVLARRLAAVGDEFRVGDLIGWWMDPGVSAVALRKALAELDQGATTEGAAAEPQKSLATVPAPPADAVRPVSILATGGVRISPLARRLAAQHGVDVSRITGSGGYGRITGKDVLAASAAGASQVHAESRLESPVAPPPIQPPTTPTAGTELLPHSLRRRTIARRMAEAGAIPSLTADMEIDLTALMASRASGEGQGASVLGLIAAAVVAGLLEHPRLNAHWRDDAMLVWHEVHLGVAVDAPDGLVVPVIRNAERLSARGLTAAITELAQKARDGSLRAEDLEGGTFTLSNPGSLGPVLRAEALLNPPQVALLGLPGIVRQAKPVPDGAGWSLAVRQVLRPSLTFDHRALDGGPVIAFLNTLKARLESL